MLKIRKEHIALSIDIFLVVVIVVSFGLYIKRQLPPPPLGEQFIPCFPKNEQGKPVVNSDCLAKVTHTLLATHSTKEVMDHVAEYIGNSDLRNQCHVIAHMIGRETFAKTHSVDGAIAQCTSACNDGCMHGVLGGAVLFALGNEADPDLIEKADEATLVQLGNTYCAESETGLCHGIGHIFYERYGDLTKALHSCDRMDTKRERCYQGVFMEGSGAPESLLFNNTQKTHPSEDYTQPCSGIAVPYQHACYMFLPHYQRRLFEMRGITKNSDRFAVMKNECETLKESARMDCFEGYGYTTLRKEEVQTHCNELLQASDRDACTLGYAHSLSVFEHLPNVTNYCAGITEESRKTLCYQVAFQLVALTRTPTDALLLKECGAGANPYECTEQLHRYQEIKATLPDYIDGLSRVH